MSTYQKKKINEYHKLVRCVFFYCSWKQTSKIFLVKIKRTWSHSFPKRVSGNFIADFIADCWRGIDPEHSIIFVKWFSELHAIVHQLRKKPIIKTYAHTQEGNQLHHDSLTFSCFWIDINKSVCVSFSVVTLQSAGLKRHFTSYIFHLFFSIEHYTWSFSFTLFLSLSTHIHKIWRMKEQKHN